MTIIEDLRSGKSFLEDPRLVPFGVVVSRKELSLEQLLERSLTKGCFYQMPGDLIGATVLGFWWLTWNGAN